MKLSEHSIKHLATAVTGDDSYTPYKKGYELVIIFNKLGFNDVYENGFPSRWQYAEEKIRTLNGKTEIKQLIESIVDPREYHNTGLNVESAVENLNDFLKYDKYQLIKSGDFYKVTDLTGAIVEPVATQAIDLEFVQDQITKCQKKIFEGDYNGAITNSRSLTEAVFIEIIETHTGQEIKNDGKLDGLYKQVKKILKLDIDRKSLPDTVIQILSGLDSITQGLAGLSNNSGDRHANKFKTEKHHARLAVNAAMTLCDFVLDVRQKRNEKK
jgi:hypothetical protein